MTDFAFKARVLALVAQIPEGRLMTYGQLATLAGQPAHAREVGHIMHGLSEDDGGLPWQRVLNAQGAISTYKVGFGEVQRGLLEREGVTFDVSGKCDLKRLQWWPDETQDQPALF